RGGLWDGELRDRDVVRLDAHHLGVRSRPTVQRGDRELHRVGPVERVAVARAAAGVARRIAERPGPAADRDPAWILGAVLELDDVVDGGVVRIEVEVRDGRGRWHL